MPLTQSYTVLVLSRTELRRDLGHAQALAAELAGPLLDVRLWVVVGGHVRFEQEPRTQPRSVGPARWRRGYGGVGSVRYGLTPSDKVPS